jgi:hypothetical protein
MSGTEVPAHAVTTYRQTARYSIGVFVFYAFLILIMVWVYLRGSADIVSSYLVPFILLLLIVYYIRYMSTHYRIDGRSFYASRLFGSRKLALRNIRKVQRANLRELGGIGMLGTWGWRGRVWSPILGPYDTVHTTSEGLLVTGLKVPVFISPRDPEAFQRELVRRVRAESGDEPPDTGPLD